MFRSSVFLASLLSPIAQSATIVVENGGSIVVGSDSILQVGDGMGAPGAPALAGPCSDACCTDADCVGELSHCLLGNSIANPGPSACVAPLYPLGHPCGANPECESVTCSMAQNICVVADGARKADLESCVASYECQSFYCKAGVCSGMPTVGDECSMDSQCPMDRPHCLQSPAPGSGTCVLPPKAAMSPCTMDEQCMSLLCVDSKCTAMFSIPSMGPAPMN